MSLSIGREINGKVIYALLANAIHPLADPEEIRIIPGKTRANFESVEWGANLPAAANGLP